MLPICKCLSQNGNASIFFTPQHINMSSQLLKNGENLTMEENANDIQPGPFASVNGEMALEKHTSKAPFTPSVSVNAAMMLVTQLLLTIMETLENGVATHFGVSPFGQ